MRTRSLVTVAVGAVAVLTLQVGPAAAAGHVERGPEHARSICSFSGLNDDPGAAAPEGGRVQSFGQLVAGGFIDPTDKANPERPGVLCNPNTLSLK